MKKILMSIFLLNGLLFAVETTKKEKCIILEKEFETANNWVSAAEHQKQTDLTYKEMGKVFNSYDIKMHKRNVVKRTAILNYYKKLECDKIKLTLEDRMN